MKSVILGVDLHKFSPMGDKQGLRKRMGLPENKFIFYTMRRLVPRMGLTNLLEAFAMARKSIPNPYLVVGGDGMMKDILQKKILDLGLENDVLMTGFVPEDRVADYYNACDLFVLPTVALEGFGLVTLEALACRTPVLATPVGAVPDILGPFDPELLIKDPSAGALAEKMIDFAVSPQKLQDVRARSREYVQDQYSFELAGQSFEQALLSQSPSNVA